MTIDIHTYFGKLEGMFHMIQARKVLAVLCAAVALVSFSACGDDDTEDVTLEADSEEETETTEETTVYSFTIEDDEEETTEETTEEETDSTATTTSGTVNMRTYVSRTATTTKKSTTTTKKTTTTTTKKTTTTTKKTTTTTKATTTTAAEDTKVYISLSQSGSKVTSDNDDGVSISGSVITISEAGDYQFSGTLTDGQIVVTADKSDEVDIYLNGVTITCDDGAPVYITSADRVTLHLVSGTKNTLKDTEDNTVKAAVYSKDDLTIKGEGTLYVYGNYEHGIWCKNDLKIKNGTIKVTSVKTALYAEDSVQITGGTITVDAGTDGVKASDEEEQDGYITMSDGTLDIEAGSDGMQADVSIRITGGTITIHADNEDMNCDDATVSSTADYTSE